MTGIQDENQITLENHEPVSVPVRTHFSDLRRNTRGLQLTLIALYFPPSEGTIIFLTNSS